MTGDNPEKGAMSPEKSYRFADTAANIFAPIYPVIASQIIERTGVIEGNGLDIGSGPGDLAISVAKLTSLKVYALDISPEMFSIVSEKVQHQQMEEQVVPILGDVHQMEFSDCSIDLIISRGSFFFWEDLNRAFSEVHRVLSPDGYAYIGSGFGTAALRDKIVPEMNRSDPDWKKGDQHRASQCDPEMLAGVLQRAGFWEFSFIQDDSGFWMVIKK